ARADASDRPGASANGLGLLSSLRTAARPAPPVSSSERRFDADPFDGAWNEVVPPQRAGSAGVYDPVRDLLWIVGGYKSPVTTNDVWTLSLGAEPDWRLIPTTGDGPPPISGA